MKALLSIVGIVVIAGVANAGPRDFIVEHAGEGGDKEAAAPYIDAFLRYVEEKAGWPKNSASGEFTPAPEDAIKLIESKKPGFALLDPNLWLELHKKFDLEVIATVEGEHQSGGHYVIVAKDAKKIEELKDKKIESNHPFSKKYLKNILGLDVEINLVPQASMIKSVKHAARGEVDGALVTDEEWKSQQASYGATLHVVWTSTGKEPPAPVVANKKIATEKDREAFVKAIMNMCQDPKGAPVCQQLGIKKFAAPDKASYDDAVRRYK